MNGVDWTVKGRELANCNCDFGCPCQFNALPTYDNCKAIVGWQVDQGHFGDIRLDGLRAIGLYDYPGAIHQGNGTMQLVIEERADNAQRGALEKILTGAETDDLATFWWITAAMAPNKLGPLFRPIELDIDVDARRGRMTVEGVVHTTVEPIRNPKTGAETRARIDLPRGFEFRIAEVASGTSKLTGEISMDLAGTHSHLARIHLNGRGVID